MPDNDELDPPPMIDPDAHAAALLENALLRAGVDLDSPQGQIVRDAWAGKTPELELIRTQWELVKPQVAPPAEPLPAAESRIQGEGDQADERRGLMAASVVEPNPEDVDPKLAAVQAGFDALMPKPGTGPAGTRDDAIAAGVHTLIEAAGRGDGRVLAHDATDR